MKDDVEWLAKSINKQEEIQSKRRSKRIDCNKKLDLPEGRDHAEVMAQLNEGVKVNICTTPMTKQNDVHYILLYFIM